MALFLPLEFMLEEQQVSLMETGSKPQSIFFLSSTFLQGHRCEEMAVGRSVWVYEMDAWPITLGCSNKPSFSKACN